jgi:subtilisin
MRRWLALALAATTMLALVPLAGGAAAAPDTDVIPGSYIVVLEAGEPGTVAAEHSRAHNASVRHVYRHALRGYAARMSAQAAARIAADPRVDYVDADRVVTTAHHQCGHLRPTPYQGNCDEPPPAETYTLSGTVTEAGSSTTTIKGATVAVSGADPVTTDDGGAYAVGGLATGDYDVTVSAMGYTTTTEKVTVSGNTTKNFTLETSTTTSSQTTPWGISRVGAPLAGNRGSGIKVYVLDTGIDPRHRDLHVAGGYAVETCKGGGCAAAWDDDHGHGTHVAGTVGAKDNDVDVVGVAPEVDLYAVKVLAKSGSGTRSGVIAGINWVAGQSNTGVARVANMSLSGSGSKSGTCTSSGFSGTDSYHQAICNATRAGVVFAVAAGNNGDSATTRVPAAYDDTVLTVSATTSSNDWPSWSNWGTGTTAWIPTASAPVALAAPGVGVLSTQAGGGTTTKSGTSMAAPHVAGAAALYLKKYPQSTAYSAYGNARAWLAANAEKTDTTAWKNTSGNAHTERFLRVGGL